MESGGRRRLGKRFGRYVGNCVLEDKDCCFGNFPLASRRSRESILNERIAAVELIASERHGSFLTRERAAVARTRPASHKNKIYIVLPLRCNYG